MNATLRQKFDELVRGGLPLKESKHWGETADKRGYFAHFDLHPGAKASMFSHDNAGAFIVKGTIQRKYAELGYERGFLGYPVADEMALKSGGYQYIGEISRFQGGSIVWCRNDGSVGVYRSDGILVASQSHGYAAEHSTALAVPNQTTLQMEAMGRTVALLIETIALQQNQLVNLSQELNALSLLRLQTGISEQASKHLNGMFETMAATLKSTSGKGEMSVGGTTHKGTLRLVRNSEVAMQRDSTHDEALSNASSIEAKLKTAVAGLFNSGVGLNVDTQQTSALIEKASEKARHVRAEETEVRLRSHTERLPAESNSGSNGGFSPSTEQRFIKREASSTTHANLPSVGRMPITEKFDKALEDPDVRHRESVVLCLESCQRPASLNYGGIPAYCYPSRQQ